MYFVFVPKGFMFLMKNIDCDNNAYAYDEQSLIIFDCRVKSGKGSNAVFVEAPGMKEVLILERSCRNWQLYLASDLGMKDHFTCPTYLCYKLMLSIRCMAENVQFTFIKATCTEFKSHSFSMISLDPTSKISDDLKCRIRSYIRSSTRVFNITNDPKGGSAPNINLDSRLKRPTPSIYPAFVK